MFPKDTFEHSIYLIADNNFPLPERFTQVCALLSLLILDQMLVSVPVLLSLWYFICSASSNSILTFIYPFIVLIQEDFPEAEWCAPFMHLCSPANTSISLALITLKSFQAQYIVSSLRVGAVSYLLVSGIELTCSGC